MKGITRFDFALLILRVGVGLIAMFYGAQKLFGVFGGSGIHGTIAFMKNVFHIPLPLAILAMVGEFFGGLGMIVGALTPLAAFGFACTMAVATYENWVGHNLTEVILAKPSPAQASEAFYTVSLFLGAVTIMIAGAGKLSVDAKLFRKGGGKRAKS